MDHFITRPVLLLASTIVISFLSTAPTHARSFYESLRAPSRLDDLTGSGDDRDGSIYAGYSQNPFRGNQAGGGFDEAEVLVVSVADGDYNSRPTGPVISAEEEIGFRSGYLAGLRDGSEGNLGDVVGRLGDWQLAKIISQRGNGRRLRRSREVHPLHLGSAQIAASQAYDTFVSIQEADERRRAEERVLQNSRNPSTSIG